MVIRLAQTATETAVVDVLTEAGRSQYDAIPWGCLQPSSTHELNHELPALIDGDTETNAIRTCDRMNAVGFSDSKMRNGCFKMYWDDVPDSHSGRFSFATSVDGKTWTRIGNCDEYNGKKQLLKNGMCFDAPNVAFRYVAVATLCGDNNLREVEWQPQVGMSMTLYTDHYLIEKIKLEGV